MLFNSYEFILVFLPIVLVVTLGASALGWHTFAKIALFVASLVFYAWWDPPYVALLLAFIIFNFVVGTRLIRTVGQEALARQRLALLVFGVGANIATLIYFKYTQFLAHELGDLLGVDFAVAKIVLPLGISFIVFQKIAFLVDAYGGQIQRLSFVDYGLFVSFFPQLISGPIVHHREVIPQYVAGSGLRYVRRLVPIGITFLVIGAFKKVVIADHFSSEVAIAFQTAASGEHHDLVGAWLGALSFTLQIYFDFSGYSDMAIGLGLLFGIRLPFNFNSPLKASSIIDFWRRWHMTLTRFLTAYLYNPILLRATRRRAAAGKRISTKGVMKLDAFVTLLVVPTLFTMFIAGAWHGAGFQFIVFGLIHGCYLVINHAWRNFGPRHQRTPKTLVFARAASFIALVFSIPYFRADSVSTGTSFITSMLGGNGIFTQPLPARSSLAFLGVILLASQILPNTQQFMHEQLEAATKPLAKHSGHTQPTDPDAWSWPRLVWRPTLAYAIVTAIVAWLVMLLMAAPSEFLYFQF